MSSIKLLMAVILTTYLLNSSNNGALETNHKDKLDDIKSASSGILDKVTLQFQNSKDGQIKDINKEKENSINSNELLPNTDELKNPNQEHIDYTSLTKLTSQNYEELNSLYDLNFLDTFKLYEPLTQISNFITFFFESITPKQKKCLLRSFSTNSPFDPYNPFQKNIHVQNYAKMYCLTSTQTDLNSVSRTSKVYYFGVIHYFYTTLASNEHDLLHSIQSINNIEAINITTNNHTLVEITEHKDFKIKWYVVLTFDKLTNGEVGVKLSKRAIQLALLVLFENKLKEQKIRNIKAIKRRMNTAKLKEELDQNNKQTEKKTTKFVYKKDNIKIDMEEGDKMVEEIKDRFKKERIYTIVKITTWCIELAVVIGFTVYKIKYMNELSSN